MPTSSLQGEPANLLLVESFERQAFLFPQKTALVYKDETISYALLNEKANQLAFHLRHLGVKKETLAAICMKQSVEKIITMLAVLKAGGAYIPLDPNYPDSRIAFILNDTGAQFLLTSHEFQDKVKEFSQQAVFLDIREIQEEINTRPVNNPERSNELSDIIYVIYTSGSTGTPKGVMVEHGAVSHFTYHHGKVLGITEKSKVLQFSSTSFDAAVIDLWIPLLQGATLYLYPDNRIIGAPLLDYIMDHDIDIAPLISPTVLSSLPAKENIGRLSTIGIGGEACPASTLQTWSAKVRLINSYGPTEATVAVTSFVYTAGYSAKTIGKANPGVTLLILDEHLGPVAKGAVGELFIGGIQVAKGYMNRPEITREKFIENPFATEDDRRRGLARLYRTGDMVRLLADDNLEFAGRQDDQIKIRGYRIEPGEIETALTALDTIQQAIVLLRESGYEHMLLAAFLTLKEHQTGDYSAIVRSVRQQLQKTLPSHMIPDRFEILESLPLNIQGKIDKDKLQLSKEEEPGASGDEHMLSADYESAIHSIWSKYLSCGVIDPDDDFFKLGGHSLLLTQVYTSLPAAIKTHIQLPDLYAYPTIRTLADETRKRQRATAPSDKEKEEAVVRELLHDATLNFEIDLPHTINPEVLGDPKFIFLTGATGFVGSHLLQELLEQTNAQIYCLVRAQSEDEAMQRLKASFHKFRLSWKSTGQSRILPVAGDLALPYFGMQRNAYDVVAEKIDVIYHSGSSVSYLQPYPIIKGSNIDGLKEIIRLATAIRPKYLALLSSMGVFSWGRPFTAKTWMHEEDDIDQNLPAVSRDLGYIKSKWVMEKMIQAAIKKGIQVINFRLGFAVCHSETGATVMNQWWGSLVRGCVEVGAFPLIMGLKDELTTVDYMSKAIVHIAKKKDAVGKNFHLSPLPENDVSMTDFFAKMNEYYGLDLKGIPYRQWLNLWKNNETNPLYPLLSLFTDDVYAGKSLVEAYENTYYYDRRNTSAFLGDSTLTPPVFNKAMMTPYLRYMGLLQQVDFERD